MRESNTDYSFYCSPRYTEIDLINEYNEVYILRAVDFLKAHYPVAKIKDILSDSLTKTSSQFENDLDQIIDGENKMNNEAGKIIAILCVLQRMLTGQLTREDSLMNSLVKATRKDIASLNAIVKQHITIAFLLPESESTADQTISETVNGISK